MPGQVPENIRLYRIVHWQNVEHILQHGLCCSTHPNANLDFINIGNTQLIANRKDYLITQLENAGSLGEYIPFYFGPHSPMLLMVKNGTAPVEKRPQDEIVYLISSVNVIKVANLEYCFTDRHARSALAGFYRSDKDFEKIDWDAVKLQYWKNTSEYQDRMDFKQAEFLVRYHLPISCVSWLAVKTENRKQYFEEIIRDLKLPVQIFLDTRNQLYYP